MKSVQTGITEAVEEFITSMKPGPNDRRKVLMLADAEYGNTGQWHVLLGSMSKNPLLYAKFLLTIRYQFNNSAAKLTMKAPRGEQFVIRMRYDADTDRDNALIWIGEAIRTELQDIADALEKARAA